MPDFLTPDFFDIFAFIATAFIYFLAPVLKYPAANRGMILIAMYAQIGYGLITLAHGMLYYLCYLMTETNERMSKISINLAYLFGILKLLLFLGSMVALVMGLQELSKEPKTKTPHELPKV